MTYVFSGTLNPTQSILREFRAKQWLLSGLNRILKKIDERFYRTNEMCRSSVVSALRQH